MRGFMGSYGHHDVIVFIQRDESLMGEPIRYSQINPWAAWRRACGAPSVIWWKYTRLVRNKDLKKKNAKEPLIFNKCKQPFQPEMVNNYGRKRFRAPLWELCQQEASLTVEKIYNCLPLELHFIVRDWWARDWPCYIMRTGICISSAKGGHLRVWGLSLGLGLLELGLG